jgi:hypothetical protein
MDNHSECDFTLFKNLLSVDNIDMNHESVVKIIDTSIIPKIEEEDEEEEEEEEEDEEEEEEEDEEGEELFSDSDADGNASVKGNLF